MYFTLYMTLWHTSHLEKKMFCQLNFLMSTFTCLGSVGTETYMPCSNLPVNALVSVKP